MMKRSEVTLRCGHKDTFIHGLTGIVGLRLMVESVRENFDWHGFQEELIHDLEDYFKLNGIEVPELPPRSIEIQTDKGGDI